MAKEVLEMEVKSNIKNVTSETDALGKSLGKANDETTSLGTGLATTGNVGSKGFKMISASVYGLGVALKALGLGLVVSLFISLKEALERNQKVMDVVNTIFTTVSITLNQVANTLTEVVSWVTQSTDRFDGLGKVMSGIGTLILTPFKQSFLQIKLAVLSVQLAWEESFFGGKGEDVTRINELQKSITETGSAIIQVGADAINAGNTIITNFGDAVGEIAAIGTEVVKGISEINIKNNIEQAKATTAAQNSSKLAEAQIQGLIEKNDKLAEKQRQIRDDETKTFAERIAANDKLNDILNTQEKEMLKLADTRVASAKLELDANKENVDLQVAYQQTLNDRAGVEAQIEGFRSEQKTNEVALDKELLEIKKELNTVTLEGAALELQELKNNYDAQVEMARKAGADITEITKKYNKDVNAINKKSADDTKGLDDGVNKARVQIAKDGLRLVGEIAKEGSTIGKAAAVASATISGVEGVQNAFTTAQKSPLTAVMPGYPFIQAGLAGAFSAIQIQKILSGSKPDGNSGGGGGGGGTPAPQMMSGAFELGGGIEPEPVKAFVLTDEMSNSQNQLANIRRRATI